MSGTRPEEERSAEVAHTHVHSLRLASGAEALAARVRLAGEGAAPAVGYGFTLNDEAIVARDMATWDALARARQLPLHALFGAAHRASVEVRAAPAEGSTVLNPWRCYTLEELRHRATSAPGAVTLLAPNAHPWELHWCAVLAASLALRELCIACAGVPATLPVPKSLGHGIDWSLEPGWAQLHWVDAA